MTRKLFFFDVETTGLDYRKHGIHQLSGCIDVTGQKVEYFDFRMRPFETDEIEDKALEIAHVTREQIAEYPSPIEVKKQLQALMEKYVNKYDKTDKFHIVGYNNAFFDNSFLREYWNKTGDKYFGSMFHQNTIDAMVLASEALQDERINLENFKLATVAKYFGVNIDESKLHDARYDIYLTRKVYLSSLEKIYQNVLNSKNNQVNL